MLEHAMRFQHGCLLGLEALLTAVYALALPALGNPQSNRQQYRACDLIWLHMLSSCLPAHTG